MFNIWMDFFLIKPIFYIEDIFGSLISSLSFPKADVHHPAL